MNMSMKNVLCNEDNTTLRCKYDHRKILSDILNSSDDSFTTPPPLSERIKTLSTPVSKTCPKESDFNSLTSTDESDKEFNALLDRIKTPLRRHEISALPSNLDENFKKFTTVEQKLRSLRISSPKTHITPITYNPVTLPRDKKARKNVFSSVDINESFEAKRTPNKKNVFNSEKKRNYVTNKSPETPLKKKEENSFLESLSSKIPISDIHREALPFRTNFKKTKDDLIKVLYKKYNDAVFSNKLPNDLSITWNIRMTKTAGVCSYYQIAKTRYAKIELSSKVLDSADRVRDTLIHELCHAASWIIHGYRDGHGSIWNYWAKRANRVLPELPEITRCHYYDIMTKYVYKCTQCGGCIGRHSKSLDVKRKLCGRCGGTFELMINRGSGYIVSTPKPVMGFARFVKTNYGSVKKAHQGIKHAEIMKKLSIQFNSVDFLDTAND